MQEQTKQEQTMNSKTVATRRPPATLIVLAGWACRIIAAIILLQTLFFKFTAAPESVYIFTKLGVFLHSYFSFVPVNLAEQWGRIGSGVMELIAAILLIAPRFVWAGALLAIAATTGAIVSHLTFLGIQVQGDKGLLFGLAVTVVLTSAISLYLYRYQVPVLGERF